MGLMAFFLEQADDRHTALHAMGTPSIQEGGGNTNVPDTMHDEIEAPKQLSRPVTGRLSLNLYAEVFQKGTAASDRSHYFLVCRLPRFFRSATATSTSSSSFGSRDCFGSYRFNSRFFTGPSQMFVVLHLESLHQAHQHRRCDEDR